MTPVTPVTPVLVDFRACSRGFLVGTRTRARPAGPHRIVSGTVNRGEQVCGCGMQVSIRISAEPLYLGHMSSDHPSISSPNLPRPLFARAAQPLTTNTPARSMPSASPSVTTNTNPSRPIHPFILSSLLAPPRFLLSSAISAPHNHTTTHTPIESLYSIHGTHSYSLHTPFNSLFEFPPVRRSFP